MKTSNPETVSVRYIVNDIDEAVQFYVRLLAFKAITHSEGFAMLSRGNLRLLLNKPGAGGAGKTLSDNSVPTPGGWSRIQLEFDDLEKTIASLKKHNAKFRNELVIGNGGKQTLLMDPSGNLIELFEPK